jgi:hypothetical protein
MKAGEEKVDQVSGRGLKDVNGWNIGALFGDRAFYKGDWLKRAAAAKGGIYGNDAVEAVYPFTQKDGTAKRSTAANTTTRSPSPPGTFRR